VTEVMKPSIVNSIVVRVVVRSRYVSRIEMVILSVNLNHAQRAICVCFVSD
jgi:hypothetical protein